MAVAPPAFPFYVGDFIVGTAGYDFEEIGAYLVLLMFQWSNDGIPNDERERQKIFRLDPRRCRRLWRKLSRKFRQGADGLWRNERLEIERAKQLQRRAIASMNGRASAFKRWHRVDAVRNAAGNAAGITKRVTNGQRKSNLSVRTYVQPGTVLDPGTSVLGTSRERKTIRRKRG